MVLVLILALVPGWFLALALVLGLFLASSEKGSALRLKPEVCLAAPFVLVYAAPRAVRLTLALSLIWAVAPDLALDSGSCSNYILALPQPLVLNPALQASSDAVTVSIRFSGHISDIISGSALSLVWVSVSVWSRSLSHSLALSSLSSALSFSSYSGTGAGISWYVAVSPPR